MSKAQKSEEEEEEEAVDQDEIARGRESKNVTLLMGRGSSASVRAESSDLKRMGTIEDPMTRDKAQNIESLRPEYGSAPHGVEEGRPTTESENDRTTQDVKDQSSSVSLSAANK